MYKHSEVKITTKEFKGEKKKTTNAGLIDKKKKKIKIESMNTKCQVPLF